MYGSVCCFFSHFCFSQKISAGSPGETGHFTFFLLFPVIRIFAITLVKNTTFYICYYLFTLSSIGYWLDDKHQGQWLIAVFLSGLATWMFLNTGLYIVLIGLASLLFKKSGRLARIKLCIAILGILLINTGYHQIFLPAIGSEEGFVREMLSIPTQQTARYCALYAEDITPKEREVMERVFLCTPEELGAKYNPELSNNAKESFLIEPTINDLKDYIFEVWWPQLLRHPGIYIDAALAQNYGYWFPDRENYDVVAYYDIPDHVLSEEENEHIHFTQNSMFEAARWAIRWVHETVSKLPGFGYLYSCALYTWLVLFLCTVLIVHKKLRECAIALPILANIGVNCISPVNAYIRYQLPIIVVVPLFLMFVLISIRMTIPFRCAPRHQRE